MTRHFAHAVPGLLLWPESFVSRQMAKSLVDANRAIVRQWLRPSGPPSGTAPSDVPAWTDLAASSAFVVGFVYGLYALAYHVLPAVAQLTTTDWMRVLAGY